MSDPKDLDYELIRVNSDGSQFVKPSISKLMKNAQVEVLEWAKNQCLTGMTPSMIRTAIHNKIVEISGEGQKA